MAKHKVLLLLLCICIPYHINAQFEPDFEAGYRLTYRNGSPYQVEKMGACPCVVDWNNDGKKDLIIGEMAQQTNATTGRAALLLNTGTDAEPKFESKEYLKDENGQEIKAYNY